MSVVLHPFCALRPRRELAEKVASPPYDVLNADEARQMAAGNAVSFLHVAKPEIDLDPQGDPYSDAVYARGKQNLGQLVDSAFTRDAKPALYVYQQTMGSHVQAGIVACTSVDDYQQNRIKKHELTRADKERDRVRHIDTLAAHDEPVFLTYKAVPAIDAIVAQVRAHKPEYDFVTPDGVGHTLWLVTDAQVSALTGLFAALECLYVADGHHRSAAAAIVRDERRHRGAKIAPSDEVNFFLAVIFPDDQMQIMPYNRVVLDLHGLGKEAFLAKVGEKFEVQATHDKQPDRQRCFGMLLDEKWYRLTAKAGSFDANDPVQSLDVSILQDNLLGPILGIDNPRTNKRIDFVGGIRGVAELEKRCRADAKVAFSMHATTMQQLMAIADAGQLMPPKSTWFEPKLRSGLFVHTF